MAHQLSLPRNLASNENDTFSKDLLRQFDKRRSRLHFELGFTSQEPSPESSRMTTPVDYYDGEPIQLDDEIQPVPTRQTEESSYYSHNTTSHHTTSHHSSKRSVSAGDLLRKSSAFLKSKFDSLKKNKSQGDNLIHIDNHQSPTKLIMKTTISIPSTARSSTFSPVLTTKTSPTITQYPPKPLVYSPIDPIPNNHTSSSKPLLHRLSMPLIRVYNESTSLSRNRSITSFGRRRKSEPDNHTKRKARKTARQN